MGKLLILVGIILFVLGLVLTYGGRIPYLGKLPGDIHIKRESFSFFFPITTSIILSVLLTLIFMLINRIR